LGWPFPPPRLVGSPPLTVVAFFAVGAPQFSPFSGFGEQIGAKNPWAGRAGPPRRTTSRDSGTPSQPRVNGTLKTNRDFRPGCAEIAGGDGVRVPRGSRSRGGMGRLVGAGSTFGLRSPPGVHPRLGHGCRGGRGGGGGGTAFGLAPWVRGWVARRWKKTWVGLKKTGGTWPWERQQGGGPPGNCSGPGDAVWQWQGFSPGGRGLSGRLRKGF